MFRKILPRKDVFFRHMEAGADKAVEIVAAFRRLMDEMPAPEAAVQRIRDIEHEADEALHQVLSDLHRTFVTPLDRNEISKICKLLDDIVDLVEGAAQRILHYDLRVARPPIRELARILENQVQLVKRAVGNLPNLKEADALRETLIEINTLENQADQILRTTIGALFREEEDPREIIKWKEVYEHIEKATDRCEDVADHIENLLLEYA